MPCLLPPFPDPTPLIVMGDEMRDGILSVLSLQTPPFATPLALPWQAAELACGCPMVPSDNPYALMHSDMAKGSEVLYDQLANPALQNFNIVCPDGSSLNVLDGDMPLVGITPTYSGRWVLSLQTNDGTGANLANVRCVAMDLGQVAVGRPAVVAEGVSNGSGALSLEVPTNTDYLVVAYLIGSPDLGGVSSQTLSPDPL